MVIVIKKSIIFWLIGAIIIITILAVRNISSEAGSFDHKDIKCVIIDPGHGSPDGGAVSKNGTVESSVNLKISLKLKEELEERGFTVIMTRSNENGLDKNKKSDMRKRLDIMNTTPADIFVSIHINKFYQSKYRGAEVLYSDNFVQSTLLAELIMSEIQQIDPKNQTRGIKKAQTSLYLMKNADIPAVIVECGFLSNRDEEKLLLDSKYQSRMAGAICEGIISYYKNVDKTYNTVETEATK